MPIPKEKTDWSAETISSCRCQVVRPSKTDLLVKWTPPTLRSSSLFLLQWPWMQNNVPDFFLFLYVVNWVRNENVAYRVTVSIYIWCLSDSTFLTHACELTHGQSIFYGGRGGQLEPRSHLPPRIVIFVARSSHNSIRVETRKSSQQQRSHVAVQLAQHWTHKPCNIESL